MHYECTNCGHLFSEPARWKEPQGECAGVPAYEEMTGCPNCHETDLTELEECINCGALTPVDEMDSEGICKDCRGEENGEE